MYIVEKYLHSVVNISRNRSISELRLVICLVVIKNPMKNNAKNKNMKERERLKAPKILVFVVEFSFHSL